MKKIGILLLTLIAVIFFARFVDFSPGDLEKVLAEKAIPVKIDLEKMSSKDKKAAEHGAGWLIYIEEQIDRAEQQKEAVSMRDYAVAGRRADYCLKKTDAAESEDAKNVLSWLAGLFRYFQAEILVGRGQLENAKKHYQEALEIFEAFGPSQHTEAAKLALAELEE